MGDMADMVNDWDIDPWEEVEEDIGFWTTKKGERMRITDMNDGHLNNTINMLARKGLADTNKHQELLQEQFRRGQKTVVKKNKRKLIEEIKELASEGWNVDDTICQQNMKKIQKLIQDWENQHE